MKERKKEPEGKEVQKEKDKDKVKRFQVISDTCRPKDIKTTTTDQ